MEKIGQFGGKYLPWHIGHITAAQKALSYVDKLYIILFFNEKLDNEICKIDGCKPMPKDLRKAWIGNSIQSLKQFGNVELLEIEYDETEYDWEKGCNKVKEKIPNLTHVFSSEANYDNYFKKYYPECEHIFLDIDRSAVNICSSKIRKNPYENWHYMNQVVRKHFVKKICITGTESTGKSTLTALLESHFKTKGIQEVGREWCIKYDNNLTIDMFNEIAIKNQFFQDNSLEMCNKYLFIDTDAVVTQYYLYQYHQKSSSLINSIIDRQEFNLFLYCKPNIEWTQDNWGHRFLGGVEERKKCDDLLLNMYKDAYGQNYINKHFKFIDADNYKDRLQQAIQFVLESK